MQPCSGTYVHLKTYNMKTITAIKINGFMQTIEAVKIEPSDSGIATALEAIGGWYHEDGVHLPDPVSGCTNDFYTTEPETRDASYCINGRYIGGHGLIIGHNKLTENDTDTTLTVEQVQRLVHFI